MKILSFFFCIYFLIHGKPDYNEENYAHKLFSSEKDLILNSNSNIGMGSLKKGTPKFFPFLHDSEHDLFDIDF